MLSRVGKLFGSRSKKKRDAIPEDSLILLWIDWEIRLLDSRLGLPTDSAHNDACVDAVTKRLLGLSQTPFSDASQQEFADALFERARNDLDVGHGVAWYWRIRARMLREDGNEAGAEFARQRSQNKSQQQLDLSDRLSRDDREMIRQRVRHVVRLVSGRTSGLRFSPSLADVASLLGLLSVLFLICGYFRITLLLRAVGLDSNHFFSVTDYLSAIASNIVFMAWPSAFVLFFFFLGRIEASRRTRSESIALAKAAGWWWRRYVVVLCVVLALYASLMVITTDSLTQAAAAIASPVLMIASMFLARPIAQNFFRASVITEAVCIFSLTMVATVVGTTLQDMSSIGRGKWREDSRVRVDFRSPPPVANHADLRIVTAGSSYFILWDNKSLAGYAIPRDAILAVSGER